MRLKPSHPLSSRRAGTLLGALLLVAGITACETDDDATDAPRTEGSVTCSYDEAPASVGTDVDLPSSEPAHEGEVQATIVTSVGEIEMVLDADAAPCTVNSFASLAEQGYFDDTICHRIETGFVIQCGDPSATGTGGPGYSYADELSGDEQYPPGTLAMANAGPDTNGSQFFIVTGDASHLSTHTVFGQVSEESLEVISEIDAAAAGEDNYTEEIESVTITS